MISELLFDTNAAIAWIERDLALFRAIRSGVNLLVSQVTIGELEFGAAKSSRPEENRGSFLKALAPFRRLTIDDATARMYGELQADLRKRGRPIPQNDAWIAAIALRHNLSVLTRDKHFGQVSGLEVVSW